MKTLSNYPDKIYIGCNEGKRIYLSAPSWDCGWYWGFGYLGNRNYHYHVDGLTSIDTYKDGAWNHKNVNLYDGFIEHFGKTLIVRKSQLWKICELFKTFYVLKESAAVLGRGGAHYTTNPAEDIIKNPTEVERINNVVLPQIFEEIYKILIPAQDNPNIDKKLVKLIVQGDTHKVVTFMFAYNIKPDDLEDIDVVTKHDYSVIHSHYYGVVHGKIQL